MSDRHAIALEVNGRAVGASVEPRLLLVHLIREVLGLTGTRVGCDTTSCGACAVLLDGRPVKSCTVLAVQADGHAIRTVEGLADGDRLSALQEGFWAEHGLQCGYCTSGMLIAATPLLDLEGEPDDETIREAISGNLCRCTGYVNIVAAIRHGWRIAHGLSPDPTPATPPAD